MRGGGNAGEISLTSTNYSPVATDLDADLDDDDWGDPFDNDWGEGTNSTHRLTGGGGGDGDGDGDGDDEQDEENLPFGGGKSKGFGASSSSSPAAPSRHPAKSDPSNLPFGGRAEGPSGSGGRSEDDDFFAAVSWDSAETEAVNGGRFKPVPAVASTRGSPGKAGSSSSVKVVKGGSLPGLGKSKNSPG